MSVSAAQLVVKIVTDSKEAESGMKSMGDSIGQAGGFMSGLLGNMLSMAGGIGIANAAGSAFGFLKDTITESYQAGMQANSVMAQIDAGLKSTKDISGQTASGLEDYATKLSDSTGIGKQAVETGQAMLLTFTGIGKNVFPQATQAMSDMATKMAGGAIPSSQQMQQTAIMLGKALDDPAKGMSALQRVGVTFDAQQQQQIKTMSKHGDVAGAQAVILKELNKEFGGSAVAAGQANGGVQILAAQFENMKEQLGQELIPVVSNLLTGLSPLITTVGAALPGALSVATTFINQNVMPAVNAFTSWVKTDGMPDLAQLGQFVTTTVVPALKQFQEWTQKYVVPALEQLGTFIMTVVLPAAKQLAEWFMAHVMPVLAQVAQIILQNVLPTLEGIATIVLQRLVPSLEHLWNVIAPILMPVLQFLGWLLQNVVGPALGFVVECVSEAIDNFANFIGSIENFVSNPSVHNLVSILQNIGNLMSNGVGGLLSGKLSLPHFADGGVMAQSGYALVGENGPEIVALPGGSRVFPNNAISGVQPVASAGAGAGGTVVLQVDGRTIARVLMPHITNGIYNATGARGV